MGVTLSSPSCVPRVFLVLTLVSLVSGRYTLCTQVGRADAEGVEKITDHLLAKRSGMRKKCCLVLHLHSALHESCLEISFLNCLESREA